MRPSRGSGPEELDLVPIMNLVTILIPFLLFSASFVTLGAIDSTLPAIHDEGKPPAEEALELSILITDDGYELAAKQDLGLGDDARIQRWDTGALTERLASIKDRWPDEQDVILVPESGIAYEVLIATMDAARRQGDRDLFPGVVVAGGT